MAETSSLFTKGSNPGPHTSAIGSDYDSFLQQQVANEYEEWMQQKEQAANPNTPVGAPRAPARPQRTLKDVSNQFTYEGVDVIKRRFKFKWDFTLNEAAADPSVTIKKIEKTDWPSFQRKPVGSKHAAEHDQSRQGDLAGVIFKRLTVKQVHTSSPEGLALAVDGIRGNAYGIGSGIRTPFFINPESNAYGINEVIHELDESMMKMADLRYSKMSQEYLEAQVRELPGKPDMSVVPVQSDITEVLLVQEHSMFPKLSDIPVFGDGSHYVLNTKVVQACIKKLLERRGNIRLPVTNLYDWKIALVKDSGEKWESTNVAKRVSDKTGLVGQELVDLPITTDILIEAEFFLISENWDQRSGKAKTTPQ